MRDVDLAYLAGIVDADGFITISRAVKRKSAGQRTPYHSLRVGITGGRAEPHRLAVELFGGRITTHRPKVERYRDQHHWGVTGARGAVVAGLLLPHLRVKVEQARLVIRFQKMMSAQAQRRQATQSPPYRITAESMAAREAMWKEMVALNHAAHRLRESSGPLNAEAPPEPLSLFPTNPETTP